MVPFFVVYRFRRSAVEASVSPNRRVRTRSEFAVPRRKSRSVRNVCQRDEPRRVRISGTAVARGHGDHVHVPFSIRPPSPASGAPSTWEFDRRVGRLMLCDRSNTLWPGQEKPPATKLPDGHADVRFEEYRPTSRRATTSPDSAAICGCRARSTATFPRPETQPVYPSLCRRSASAARLATSPRTPAANCGRRNSVTAGSTGVEVMCQVILVRSGASTSKSTIP